MLRAQQAKANQQKSNNKTLLFVPRAKVSGCGHQPGVAQEHRCNLVRLRYAAS